MNLHFRPRYLFLLCSVFLSSCGGGGSSNTSPAPDTSAPSVTFSPSSLTVESGETTGVTLTATDNIAVTSGPDVECDNGGEFANGNFTAPTVAEQTTVTCTAMASDAAGNQGDATLSVTVNPPPDTTPPSLEFTPSSLTVVAESISPVTLTASDDNGITTGPDVECDNGGNFTNGNFTAPNVTEQTIVTCTATASDAAGNQGDATLSVTVNLPPDTTPPSLSFTPSSLTVDAESISPVTLTASDDRGITTGPDVECDNGGVFSDGNFTAPAVSVETTVICTASASDAADNQGSSVLTVVIEPLNVTIATRPNSPIQVNLEESGRQNAPDFTYLDDGSIVVVWVSSTSDPRNFNVRGRRFDAAGSPLADEFSVNTLEAGLQLSPSIVPIGGGGFVVGWTSSPGTGPIPPFGVVDNADVFVQRFDSTGQKVGPETKLDRNILINNNGASSRDLFLLGLESGGFIGAWNDGDIPSVVKYLFQKFDSVGEMTSAPVEYERTSGFDNLFGEKIAETSTGRTAIAYSLNRDARGSFVNYRLFDTLGVEINSTVFPAPFPNGTVTQVQDLITLDNDTFALVTSEGFTTATDSTTSLHIIDNDGNFLSTQQLAEGVVNTSLARLPEGGFVANLSTTRALNFDNLGNIIGSEISLAVAGPSQFDGNGGGASVTTSSDSDGDGVFLNLFEVD